MKGQLNVENVVASVSLGQPIDLYALASKNPYLRYEPEKFPAIHLKFVNPRVTILIFSSGKAVIVGARSEEDVKRSSRNLASFLKRNGVGLKREPKVAIKNIVTTFSLGQRIDLERLGMALRGAVYEPEEFPGLIYRNYGVVFIMFSSGKVICTGSKNEAQAVQAFKEVAKEIDSLLMRSFDFQIAIAVKIMTARIKSRDDFLPLLRGVISSRAPGSGKNAMISTSNAISQ